MNGLPLQAPPAPAGRPARLPDLNDLDDARATRSVRVVWWIALFLALFFAWAWWFEIDEVSSGSGKVIPSSREQHIQSLEGGILAELRVQEGQIVEKGQVLAQLDPTRGESSVEETAARYRAALAASARLRAEVEGQSAIDFPAELDDWPQLKAGEAALFRSRRASLGETLGGLQQALGLVRRELEITRSLVASGAASNVELIRLQRQAADLELKIAETRANYMVKAREELAKADAEVKSLSSVVRGRADTLARLTLHAPVRGVVKKIDITTFGGVVPPNGSVMTLVPLDDQLLVETRISPRDIAFIHPGQSALVKVTAYDYAIYGGLEGEVVTIAPDTLRDEVKPEVVYYPVLVRTSSDALVNKAGQRFPIVPGMVTTVDIRTGRKSVWDYLIKPFNRAREALRER
ncbi:HlyD family efflux transporter periplasmic adaptor subunit [Caldimonas thermodepolymerans]|uniref:HlyD family efflux transporter periplasmic adaptor subunit n=1 Tax=Caldimonas thermodepolymerans TaxID=215580 RepID=UPI002236756D|nr:HlyD family efflux transporter periplasmic adaptor subunit [Caldimonas thermodepolymerans]UZG43728.1 HlyD family efflux transporter periplasmic adaptor subunit [Caldimonas thermodepolymerans]